MHVSVGLMSETERRRQWLGRLNIDPKIVAYTKRVQTPESNECTRIRGD